MIRRIALAAACVLALSAPARAAGPRIVSINPCIDAVLMHVADAGQIAGISHYSQDPAATSIPIAQARRFHATSGTAEEVVALAPDLVLAGAHVSPATIHALKRMNIRLLQYRVPESIAESATQVRAIAAAIGHPVRGDRLAGAIRAAAMAARPADRRAVPALIWLGGGLVPGKGTLADELLRASGFSNASAAYGLKQWDILPLEYLVARPPALLLSANMGRDRMVSHPVLQRLERSIAIRAYPERLLHCGGPGIIDALARLSAIRREVVR